MKIRISILLMCFIVCTAIGAFAQTTSPLRAVDRFGESVEYLPVSRAQEKSAFQAQFASTACGVQAGHFYLDFEDCELNRGYGFDDPTQGQDRRAIVQRVFEDLSELIISTVPPGDLRVLIEASEGDDGTLDVQELAPTAVGVASETHILGMTGGITHGLVWKTLVSGVDAWDGLQFAGFDPDNYHGQMRINFDDFNFHLVDFSNPGQAFGANDHDLYTIVLHEAIHMLGFYSLVNQDTYQSQFGNDFYNNFDLYLEDASGNSFVNYTQPYATQVNPAITFTGTTPCSMDIFFEGIQNTQQVVYYAPGNGSSLSHFNCDATGQGGCATGNGYSMNTCRPRGTAQRHPHPNEVGTLCDLGYETSGHYGLNTAGTVASSATESDNFETYASCTSSLCNAVAVNDEFPSATISGTPTNITYADLLTNDINATGIVPGSIELVSPINSGNVQVVDNGSDFDVVPTSDYVGTAIVRYQVDCGTNAGTFGFVFIQVNIPPDPICTQPGNSCNLVCNGDFEAFTNSQQINNFRGFFTDPNGDRYRSSTSSDLLRFDPSTTTFPIPNGLSFFNLPNFLGSSQKVDFITNVMNQTCTTNYQDSDIPEPLGYPQESNYVGLFNNENLRLSLNQSLIPGNTYRLSFWANLPCEDYNVHFVFSENPPEQLIGQQPYNDFGIAGMTYTFQNGLISPVLGSWIIASTYEAFHHETVHIDNTRNLNGDMVWTEFFVDFQVNTNDLDELVIFGENASNHPVQFAYLLIDNISIEPVGTPQIPLSSQVVTSCAGGSAVVAYEICSPTAINNLDLEVDNLPFGVTLGQGGDFTNGQITGVNVPANQCMTFDLHLELDPNLQIGASLPISLSVAAPGACLDANAQDITMIDITAGTNPLEIDLVNNNGAGPYAPGNLLNYTVNVTNHSTTDVVEDIDLELIVPNGFTLNSPFTPQLFDLQPGQSVSIAVDGVVQTCYNQAPICASVISASNGCQLPLQDCESLDVLYSNTPLELELFNLSSQTTFQVGDLIPVQVVIENTDPNHAIGDIDLSFVSASHFSPIGLNNQNINIGPGGIYDQAFEFEVVSTSCGVVDLCFEILSAEPNCGLPMAPVCLSIDLTASQWPVVDFPADDAIINDLYEDPDGSVYLTGELRTDLHMDGVQNGDDMFLAKLNACGGLEWFRRTTHPSPTEAVKGWTVEGDGQGLIYVAGEAVGRTTFEGGNNQDVELPPFNGSTGAFLLQYESNGDLRWVSTLTGNAAAGAIESAFLDVKVNTSSLEPYITGYINANFAQVFTLYHPSGLSATTGTIPASNIGTWTKEAFTGAFNAAGSSTWWDLHRHGDGDFIGRYLNFQNSDKLIVTTTIERGIQHGLSLIDYTNQVKLHERTYDAPLGKTPLRVFGTALDTNGQLFVHGDDGYGKAYIAKYEAAGFPTIFFKVFGAGWRPSRYSLAHDWTNEQLLIHTTEGQSTTALLGWDLNANTYTQLVQNEVPHGKGESLGTAFTFGSSATMYTAGNFPFSAYFLAYGNGVNTSLNPNGLDDLYVARYLPNGGNSANFRTEDEELILVNMNPPKKVVWYPNPVSDVLHIETNEIYSEIVVSDLSGRAVKRTSGQYTLDLSALKPGLYLVQLLDEKGERLSSHKIKVKH